MSWFGPSKDEVWKSVCDDIGAEFIQGGFWKGGSRVQATSGPWTITLETYGHGDGETHYVSTRIRAPFVNLEKFRFTIDRAGFFTELGKLFGMQDIELGEPDFDTTFVIQGTDEYRVRELLTDARVRRLLSAQPKGYLEVRDPRTWFRPAPGPDVDELRFITPSILVDRDLLLGQFELIAAVLNRLQTLHLTTSKGPVAIL